jgi:hypothetical protein
MGNDKYIDKTLNNNNNNYNKGKLKITFNLIC